MMEGPEINQEYLSPFLALSKYFSDGQELELYSPAVVVIVGGLALLASQLLLPLLAPLLSGGLTSPSLERHLAPVLQPLSLPGLPTVALTREERPRLQNHPRCGITTGGEVRPKFAFAFQPIQKYVFRRNVGGIVRSSLILLATQHCLAKPLQTLLVSAIASPRAAPVIAAATHPALPL